MPASPQWGFGRFRLDPQHACLWRDAEAIVLTPKAFAVLHYLVQHPDRLVTKDELLEAVWPETAVNDAVVRVAIGALRKVLGDQAQTPQYIATVARWGYRFLAPVTLMDMPETLHARVEPAPLHQERVPPAPEVRGTQEGADTWRCAACQHLQSRAARFCVACGAPHVAICQACGQAVSMPATFCSGCGQRLGALPNAVAHHPLPASLSASLSEKVRASRMLLEGERKQVTVLFADIQDSLALIRSLDPEVAQQLLDPVLHLMIEVVHRYDGTVNQVLGDGIMALFGAPIAHEDHAARACYAALTMQAALRNYAQEVRRIHDVTMQSRIGLNSGEVVVRAIRSDLHMDYSAVGQTTHLASRLEQLTSPDTILLSEATVRLVEGLVRVKSLGLVSVRGLSAPVEVFELLGASGLRRRLQSARARGLTHFVGRQTEMTILHAALTQAGAGHGQIVAVVGEAGMGKSRLVDEFVQVAHHQGWLVLDSAAVSYGQATPYFPILDLLRRYCHLEEGEDAGIIQTKVTEQVRTLDDALEDTIPPLLALLDALPEGSSFLQLDAPQRRQLMLFALKRFVLRESQRQPVLWVCEDLHWLDTETQALLESLSESLPTTRLLLLINYRPDYRHGWGSKTYYTQLRLDPLPLVSAEALLQTLLGDDPSLASLTLLLIHRTEGNPFFLEENVRTLVETGVLIGEPGAYRMVQALPAMQVPATVQTVLAARIDRPPAEEKRLLQTAAVIGMEVPLVLLQAVAELPGADLRLGLTHLQDAEFLYEASLFPELVYTFKHALTQEVAYGSLLRERRRMLHTDIVAVLEMLAGDRVTEQVERLAHHALRGEVWEKTLAYCRQAGEKAMARSAHREAAGYFEQALGALPHLPETRATREQAIDLRLALCSALRPLGDFERMLTYLREAESLASALNDPRRLGWLSVLLSRQFYLMEMYDQAIATAQRVLALATSHEDADPQARVNQYLGATYLYQGDYRRAIHCLRQTAASLDGTRRYEHVGDVFLPAVFSRSCLAWCHAELGMFVEGAALGEEGLQLAEAGAHLASFIWAYYGIGMVSFCQGDPHRAIPQLERAVDICHEVDLPGYLPRMAAALGAAYTLGRRVDDAVPLLTQMLERSIARGRSHHETLCSLPLGEAHMLAGRLEEAHALARRTLAIARAHQGRGNQAYALRLLGDIAARREPPAVAQAEAHYREALVLAEELGMRPLQAHCHLGLGMLYCQIGRKETRAALDTAITLYRAMAMTFWLPRAEAALAQVSSSSASP